MTKEEVLAIQLYSGVAYFPINRFLRNYKKDVGYLTKEKTFAKTVELIYTAFEKLVKSGFSSQKEFCYRGLNGQLTKEFFIPDSFGMMAFSDFGFFSTSTDDQQIKAFYSENQNHLIIKINQMNSDITGNHRGVDISWLSLVNSEKEVLFPPLTLFEVKERKKEKKKVSITVFPTYSLG